MKRNLFFLMILIAAVGCANACSGDRVETSPATQGESKVAGTDLVNLLTDQFYSGEFEDIHQRFSVEMKQQVSLDRLRLMHEYMVANFGKEVEVVDTEAKQDGEYRGFVRWAKFDKYDDGLIKIQWYLKPDDTVGGFQIEPTKSGAGQTTP